jgi:hypothetical protein
MLCSPLHDLLGMLQCSHLVQLLLLHARYEGSWGARHISVFILTLTEQYLVSLLNLCMICFLACCRFGSHAEQAVAGRLGAA